MDSDESLIAAARAVLNPRRLSTTVEAAGVGAVMRSASGVICTGLCIDAASGIGCCAEHGAVAAMITAGAARVTDMVAVDWDGSVLAPCGRCRELVVQIDDANALTRVILPGGVKTKRALLPDHWLLDRQVLRQRAPWDIQDRMTWADALFKSGKLPLHLGPNTHLQS